MDEVQAVPRKRRRWPWVVLGVIGLVLALVALAPTLFAGPIANAISRSFAADHRGRLELGGLDLAWFSRQKVDDARLLDPQGAEVARASVDLPSLFALASSGGKKVGEVNVDARAQLVAADDGTTNLQRALEPTDEAKRRASEPKQPSEPTDWGALLRELDLDLEVRVASLEWSDARTRALGKPFELADLVATVTAKPNQPLALEVNGVLASEGNVPLKVGARITDLFAGAEINPNARFEVDADVQSLPSGLIDALAAQDGLVSALFGERLSVTASGAGTLTEGGLEARIAGDVGALDVACRMAGGVLMIGAGRLEGGKPFVLRSSPDAEKLNAALASKLPADLEARWNAGGEIVLEVQRLDVNLNELFAAPSGDTTALIENALAKADFAVSAQLGSWSVAPVALGLSEPARLDAVSLLLELGDSRVLSAQLSSSVAKAELRGALRDGVWHGETGKALVASLTLEPKLAQALATRFAPADTEIVLPGQVDILVRELEIPVRAVLEGGDAKTKLLEGLRASAEISADSLRYIDKRDASVPKSVELGGCLLALQTGPNGAKSPLVVSLKSALKPAGNLELELSHPDLRALAAFTPENGFESLPVRVVAKGLSTSWLASWAGSELDLPGKLGPTLDLELDARVAMPKGEAATAELKANATSAKGSAQLTSTLNIAKPLELAAQLDAGAVPQASATFGVVDDGLVYAFVPETFAADVRELVGSKFGGQVHTKSALVTATLRAERVELDLSAHVAERELSLSGDDALKLVLKPTAALLERHAGASLPAGAKLAFVGDEPQVTLEVRELVLPLDAWMPAEGQAPAELADVVRRAAAQLKLALPSVRYEQPPLTAAATSVPIDVEELVVAVSLTPAKPALAHVTGRVAGAQGGRLMLDASCADPGAFLLENAPLPPLELNADIAGLPTALVDALAGQEGLLVDTLGPALDLKLAGKWPSPPDQPLRAELKSAQASVDLVALFTPQALNASGEQGLDATLPLSPLLSKRVVGNLVPLLVNATKPEGAKPLELSVSDFVLPLDGDLRKLNGTVQLDLGEITYDLLPGLSDVLSTAGIGDIAQKRFTIEPLTIPIVNGVARYDRLPLKIGGEQVVFKGSFDIVTREMSLATSLPLKALGSKVEKELERVREYLDPNLLVPLELKGAWNKPRISLGKDFVENVVKDAAKGAVKKGLLDLLDEKLKKDKEKDGGG